MVVLCLLFAGQAIADPTADPSSASLEPPPEGASFAELQEGAEGLERELESARKTAAEIAAKMENAALRRAAIPGEITALNAELAKTPAGDAPPADADEATIAAYTAAAEKRKTLADSIAKLEAESARYQSNADKNTTEKRHAEERATALAAAYMRWQKASDLARTREAAVELETAADRAKSLAQTPALAALAKGNLALADRRARASKKVASAHSYETEVAARTTRFRREKHSAEQRVQLLETAGLRIDPETGTLLRAQRERMEKPRAMRAALRERLRESATAELEQLQLDTERSAEGFGDLDARVGAIVDAASKPKPDPIAVRSLLDQRRSIYDSYSADLAKRLGALSKGNAQVTLLIDETAAHALYLDERLLWIPSEKPLGKGDLALEGKALGGLWQQLVDSSHTLVADFRSSSLVWLAFGAFLVALLCRRGRLHKALTDTGAVAIKRNCQSFVPTAIALGCTFLLALPLPLILGFLAWRCSHPSALGSALFAASLFTALVGTARLLARPGGILEAHFRFEPGRARILHRNLSWFIPLGAVVVIIAAALPESAPAPAGRLFFVLAMLLLLVLLHSILKPSKGMVRRRGKPTKLAYIWYAAGTLIPASLAIGAALGFFESVQTLRLRAVGSLWLLLAGLFVVALLLRWILVSRRRLAVAQALRRREIAIAERTGDATTDLPSLQEAKDSAIDVVGVEEQTSRLVHVTAAVAILFGLFGIWADTLPALSVLDKVTLWPTGASAAEAAAPDATSAIPGMPQATDGGTTSEPRQAIAALVEPTTGGVTLGDLLTAIILLALTFVAAQNIPGLLELTVLRRLNLKPGGSFAFTTSVRYLIVVVGIVIAFGKIGITWSNVQWIAAAITLGVGFGLQEVFANFVAGLILLFERPFRIGDVVTVGDVSGKVTQIRMRATTIRQFNSRELVVPNKDFITGQLVNWTLTDGVLRFEIPVGIAYGSDTEKARSLLLKLADEHPNVIADPAPQVIFTAFGDSALNFELRAHVGQIDHNLATKNELFFQIDTAFREAGIEIAFPQTDIHIRSMPEGGTEPAKT